MSSVVSFKSNATSQTQYSRRSDNKSLASGYTRGSSAYSQRRKDLLEQEHKKELDDLLQKQMIEQERHKKIMMENKKRTKAQQEQLKKELETKKQQEEELLRKMKEDKKTAYIKYLKENSKELLQNFKAKKEAQDPQQEEAKDSKKTSQANLAAKKNKSTPVDIPKNPKQRLVGNVGQQRGNMGNVYNQRQTPTGMEDYMENQNNLEALDLDISRSTNNLKKIIDQYHKDIEKVKQIKQDGPVQDKKNGGIGIPMQEFYDKQPNKLPQMQASKLLDSLDLSSSLTNWNPGKQPKGKEKVVEPTWQVRDSKPSDERKQSPGRYAYGEYEERKEDDNSEEVEENIEVIEKEDSPDKKPVKSSSTREVKKLEKISDVSQKQLKQDWYLKYVDNHSGLNQQGNKSGPSQASQTSTSSVSGGANGKGGDSNPTSQENNFKRAGSFPSSDAANNSKGGNVQAKQPEKKHVQSKSPKKNDALVQKSLESIFSPEKAQENDGYALNWANDVKEDDFYKGLNQKVPSSRENKQRPPYYQNKTPSEISGPSAGYQKPPNYNKPPIMDSAIKMNAMEADEVVFGGYPANLGEPVNIPTGMEQGKMMPGAQDKNPLAKKKQPSVTGAVKKEAVEKENKGNRRNSGLRSKLEGHVNAAQRINVGNKKDIKKGGKRPLSPTTRGTRDTDLDVEEFLQDDFNMLNQEEANLQKEIMELHMKEIAKVREVEQKHNINTKYQNMRQVTNKAIDSIPFADKIVNEEDLEDSLDRLDMILSKQRTGAPVSQVTAQFNQGVPVVNQNMQNQQQQMQMQMQAGAQFQRDNNLYNQVMMNRETPPSNYQPSQVSRVPSQNMPMYQGNIVNSGYNAQPDFYNKGQGFGTPSNAGMNNYGYQMPGNDYPSSLQKVGAQSLQTGIQGTNYQAGGMSPEFGQKGMQSPPSFNAAQQDMFNPPVNAYSPYNNQPYQYMPGQPVQKVQNMPYNAGNMDAGVSSSQTQESGYNRNLMNRGPSSNPGGSVVAKPPLQQGNIGYGNMGMQQNQGNTGYSNMGQGLKEEPENIKTFSFNSKNMQGNLAEAQRLRDSMEGSQFGDKKSMVSGKSGDQMSEMGQSGFRGDITRMTIDEKTSSYAVKKIQQKEYQNKKQTRPKEETVVEKPKEEGEGSIKIVANANLKHLLMDD